MTTRDRLEQAHKQLEKAAIATARLDTLILLEDITNKDRSWLLAHPDHIVRGSTSHKFA